jgi:hypothetical protein
MTAVLNLTEDQIFDAVWALIVSYFDPADQGSIFKGFQNQTSTPPGGSYVVISPGINVRQNQLTRGYTYDPLTETGTQDIERSTTYSYQVDCYGPKGPDWANTIAIAWNSLWSCDNNAAPATITPLYADEPSQLNIVNGELQFEQRFNFRIYGQVNQVVALPQDFFTTPPDMEIIVADLQ